jgi:hypothetical protein
MTDTHCHKFLQARYFNGFLVSFLITVEVRVSTLANCLYAAG